MEKGLAVICDELVNFKCCSDDYAVVHGEAKHANKLRKFQHFSPVIGLSSVIGLSPVIGLSDNLHVVRKVQHGYMNLLE